MHAAEAAALQTETNDSDSDPYDDLESKTVLECSTLRKGGIVKNGTAKKDYSTKKKSYLSRIACTYEEMYQTCTLLVIGVTSWGLLYCSSGGRGWWHAGAEGGGGELVRPAAAATLGYAAGQLLQRLTPMPSLLGALLCGVLLRNVGFIDMRDYAELDSFLRKVYPVIILGKSALGLEWWYYRSSLARVLAVGAVPWAGEVVALAACLRYTLDYPWLWGLLVGAAFASLSPAVLAPSLQRLRARGVGAAAGGVRDLPRLVVNAGCVDTMLSVGVYGLLLSFIFTKEEDTFTIVRACLTMFAGISLGVCWGYVASAVPSKRDPFVAESRLLVVLVGGLLANFGTLAIGWGGTGGVAVLLCNMTAAHCWQRSSGWQYGKNPVATAYRVMWTILEPILFTYTGAYVVLSEVDAQKALLLAGAVGGALAVRLLIVFAVGWCCGLAFRERIFVCAAWIPKAIVEMVLAPTALEAVRAGGEVRPGDRERAQTNIQLLALAVVVTTPLGVLLVRWLGPALLAPPAPRDTTERPAELTGSVAWSTRMRLGEDADKPGALDAT